MRYSKHLLFVSLFVVFLIFSCVVIFCIFHFRQHPIEEENIHQSTSQEYEYFQVNIETGESFSERIELPNNHNADLDVTYKLDESSFSMITPHLYEKKLFGYCQGKCFCDRDFDDFYDYERRAGLIPLLSYVGLVIIFNVPERAYEYGYAGRKKFKEECYEAISASCPENYRNYEIDKCTVVNRNEMRKLQGSSGTGFLDDREKHKGKNFMQMMTDGRKKETVVFSCSGSCSPRFYRNRELNEEGRKYDCYNLEYSKDDIEVVFRKNRPDPYLVKWKGLEPRASGIMKGRSRMDVGEALFHNEDLQGFCRKFGTGRVEIEGEKKDVQFCKADTETVYCEEVRTLELQDSLIHRTLQRIFDNQESEQ